MKSHNRKIRRFVTTMKKNEFFRSLTLSSGESRVKIFLESTKNKLYNIKELSSRFQKIAHTVRSDLLTNKIESNHALTLFTPDSAKSKTDKFSKTTNWLK